MTLTPSTQPSPPPPAPPPVPAAERGVGWTAGRIVSLVIGCILALVSLGVLSGAGFATWAANSRDNGFVMSGTHTVTTPGYAVTSDQIDFWTATNWATPADILGTIRVQAKATSPTSGVFIGVAPTSVVDNYLAGVSREVVTGWGPFSTEYRQESGAAPRTAPVGARIWTAQTSGFGTQKLDWRPSGGNWTIVVMNPSGSAGVSATASMGASIPDLAWFAVAMWIVGGLLLLGAVVLIAVPVSRASR